MLPADLANRALDALGVVGTTIGDLEEGTKEAKVLLRQYGPCMRQLFRAANWNFARRQDNLVLLQDATGFITNYQIANGIPNTVGPGTVGMRPWIYSYRWPPDAVKVRFLPEPWCETSGTVPGGGAFPILAPGAPGSYPLYPPGNTSIPPVPLTTGNPSGAIATVRQIPRRFLVTNDVIPNLDGQQPTWNQVPDTSTTLGQGLTSQTVILCNHQRATAVYTALLTYPDQWDPLFQEAFVAVLAERCALSLVSDRKAAVAIRNEQVQIAKAALDQARMQDGQEGWHSVDHEPDWLKIRNSGSRWGINGPWDGSTLGVLGYGWDSFGFSNGSAY